MDPTKLSVALNAMAGKLDASRNPDRARVAADLNYPLSRIAADMTAAYSYNRTAGSLHPVVTYKIGPKVILVDGVFTLSFNRKTNLDVIQDFVVDASQTFSDLVQSFASGIEEQDPRYEDVIYAKPHDAVQEMHAISGGLEYGALTFTFQQTIRMEIQVDEKHVAAAAKALSQFASFTQRG